MQNEKQLSKNGNSLEDTAESNSNKQMMERISSISQTATGNKWMDIEWKTEFYLGGFCQI